jgi:polar amino acid transport system permease protein
MTNSLTTATVLKIRGGTAGRDAGVPVLERPRRYGQWVAGAMVLLLAGCVIYSLATNHNLGIGTIGHYMFSSAVLNGVGVTVELTAISFVTGLVIGLVVALMLVSHNPVMRWVAFVYVWVFRAVPPLVQLIFCAFIAALYSHVIIGVPFTHTTFVRESTQSLISPFGAAIISFTIVQAAYCAEIIRAGLNSVHPGQREAAHALGLSKRHTYSRVLLPQAMPSVLPNLGNMTIILLKGTALVSVIGTFDLMTAVQNIYARTYQVIPLLMVVSIWYLLLVSVLSAGQHYLDRRFGTTSAVRS